MTQPSFHAAPLAGSALQARYQAVRDTTTGLTRDMSAEDCQLQSMPDASPVKWHLAHTSWFFETFILERFEPDFRPHDARFRVLFNSYYNAVGDKHPRPQRGLISRPNLDEVMSYRRAVDARMSMLFSSTVMNKELESLLEIGLQHEQQHQELILTDFKHALSCNPAMPAHAQRWPLSRVSPQALHWVYFEGGLVEIGHEGDAFCFDNETPRHKTYLYPYALSSRLVTHGEWAQFIAEGGYSRHELWLSMGWDWVQSQAAKAPLYWFNEGTDALPQWHSFTLRGAVPIDPHTPICHINYFEADAYARWAGARLPTEAEWEHAAQSTVPDTSSANLLDMGVLHPMPTHTPFDGSMQQMLGDVWEWTSSAYAPYPGYQPWQGAVGEYNGKFMCNQYVLRGGSCATPCSHIRASYRNFFPAHTQWQFSGLRLARSIA
jgi:ergothioneine biosynthesis protein EgtB